MGGGGGGGKRENIEITKKVLCYVRVLCSSMYVFNVCVFIFSFFCFFPKTKHKKFKYLSFRQCHSHSSTFTHTRVYV